MTEQEFKEFLAYGREQRGIEFKGPGPRTDKHLLAKVVRAVLLMSNRRDGGIVIVGVDENENGGPVPWGLSEADLKTWSYDDFSDSLAGYADPNVSFDLEILEYEGNNFIIIQVHEFEDIPVLCKKHYPEVLREGACYVRTRRKPETAEIPSQTEMRDLLDLAITKALRKYISIGHSAGFDISAALIQKDDGLLFNKQLGDLLED